MNRFRMVATLPIVLALVAAGCGSSNKSNGNNAAAASSPSTSSTAGSSGGQATATTNHATASAALITTKHDNKLGTILAYGPKRLTVYLFEADKGASSSCSGACAAAWPPVLGKPQASGAAMSADLGTITRPDGRTQVTYKGHPLYLFEKDKDDGDAYGQGINNFGASWYALKPTGTKVDLS